MLVEAVCLDNVTLDLEFMYNSTINLFPSISCMVFSRGNQSEAICVCYSLE